MVRWVPDVEWTQVELQRAEVVVVVDTSGAGDESARQLKTATAEAVLRALSAGDRFALVALDVKPVALHPAEGLAPADEKNITAALEQLAGRLPGGATDLSAVFDVALSRLHGAEQPAVIYVGDGWATSGELSGEALGERLRRALSSCRARFFTVAVGADANQALLAELARNGGGRAFAVDDTEQATDRALQIAAAIKTPTLTELEIDLGAGLDEGFVSANGKVSRGEEVTLFARSHHDLPPRAKVRGRLAGKPFERDYRGGVREHRRHVFRAAALGHRGDAAAAWARRPILRRSAGRSSPWARVRADDAVHELHRTRERAGLPAARHSAEPHPAAGRAAQRPDFVRREPRHCRRDRPGADRRLRMHARAGGGRGAAGGDGGDSGGR